MVSGSDVYLCEFLETFPETTGSRGNYDFGATEYIRTHPDVIAKNKDQCHTTKKDKNETLLREHLPFTSRIVMHIVSELFQNTAGTGYHLYTDRYYTR